jgi:hypothetical protein
MIKCMEMDNLLDLMVKVIQDNISKMKNKVEGNLTMEMDPIIKVNG